MADTKQTVQIDKDLRPAYYDDFHCLAANCRLNCCKNWRITFGKKDYLSLKRQKGSADLNDRVQRSVRRVHHTKTPEMDYGEFALEKGVCPFQGEDGLCVLQVEKGPDALPFVCQSFPRKELYVVSGYLERALTPSCEGVLELMWNLPDGIDFRSDPLPRNACRNMNYEGPSDSLILHFQTIRSVCIDLLQDRKFSLPDRMILVGLALKELADGETNIVRWQETVATLPENLANLSVLEDNDRVLTMFLMNNFHVLTSIQNMDISFKKILQALKKSVKLTEGDLKVQTTIRRKVYCDARERYEKNFGDREYFMENLMVSLFFYLHIPDTVSLDSLWKSYINFCNLYSFYRFITVMSCREEIPDDMLRDELIHLLVMASRELIHNGLRQSELRDEFFRNDSATLAHMAILVNG